MKFKKFKKINKLFQNFNKYKKIIVLEFRYIYATLKITGVCDMQVHTGVEIVDKEGNKYTQEMFEFIAQYNDGKLPFNKIWAGIL